MFVGKYFYRGICEFCSDLVEVVSSDVFFWVGDDESVDWRVVRGLFGEV